MDQTAFFTLSSGLYIVSAVHEDTARGCVVNTVLQVTNTPAQLSVTVNKGNELGIRAYEGKGFATIDAVETDIGEGYIMDDYIMEKRIS